MSVREAILAAGHERFRPIVMNTLTVMLSVLPMMFGIGAGEQQHGLVAAVPVQVSARHAAGDDGEREPFVAAPFGAVALKSARSDHWPHRSARSMPVR